MVARVDTNFVLHEDRDMGRNVTFKLDDETLRQLRVRAAERGTSLSKLVSEMLQEELRRLSDRRSAEHVAEERP
jgi:plasmid stability protein